MLLNVNSWGFRYQDSEYFEWFSAQDKSKEMFLAMLKWKGLNRRIEENLAWERWQSGHFEKCQPVTRAFLHHLRAPQEYPLLDRYVWRAMKHLSRETGETTNKNACNWKKDYLDGYKTFFDGLYAESCNDIQCSIKISGVDMGIQKRRILDRALWEYGRLLPV